MSESLDRTDSVQVFSVGHSDHSIEDFLALLRQHWIDAVADVRSQPYSQWVPQFNREPLQRSLEAAGVHYVFLGHLLGGRPANALAVQSEQTAHLGSDPRPPHPFEMGIDTLMAIASQRRTAMMCAEGDHRRCHRDKLITPALLERAVQVMHIQHDGEVVEARPKPRQLGLL
jgi:uncharacterized protein (DUF488 family)